MIVKAIESKSPAKTLKKDGKSSFFLYVNNTIPHSEHVMADIYEKHKAQDGFLYITYGEMEKF